jgi:hypothetical protein
MIVIAAIGSAMLMFVTNGLNHRAILDGVRDRQYAADAGVESSIARVRAISNVGLVSCGGPDVQSLDSYTIHVECTNAPTLTLGNLLQRNVIFAACLKTGAGAAGVACTESTTIVRAQVNFVSNGGTVSRTWVQSWSVNQ